MQINSQPIIPIPKTALLKGIFLSLAPNLVLANQAPLNEQPAYQVFFGNQMTTPECLPDTITPRPLDFFLTHSPDNEFVAGRQPSPTLGQVSPQNLNIQANQFTQTGGHIYEFQGNTSFWQEGLLIFSPYVRIDQTAQSAFLGDLSEQNPNQSSNKIVNNSDRPVTNPKRNVTLFEKSLSIQAKQLRIKQNSEQENDKTLEIDFAKYQLFPSRAYGKAQNMRFKQRKEQLTLTDADLSTCPAELPNGEGDKDWHLEFDELKIDRKAQRVIGKHALLKIRDIPVFYTPYFNYPLNDRASGLLFPSLGTHSALTNNQSVAYYKQPYFFNLAPNYDATLTALAMTERGVLLDGEFRALTRLNGQTHRINLQAGYLRDSLAEKDGVATIASDGSLDYASPHGTRWRINLDSSQNWGQGWSSQLQWHDVSDGSFYSDLPLDDRYDDASEIRQNAMLRYNSSNFNAYLQTLSYTPLRTERNLYQKRPELGANWIAWQNIQWKASIDLKATDFVAKNDFAKITPLSYEGARGYIAPSLSYQHNTIFSRLKLNTKFHQRSYQLEHTQNTSELDKNIGIPEFSAYGSLKFERHFSDFFGSTSENLVLSNHTNWYTQTLEPELQYVYIPYRNQQAIPLFDTSRRSLDFNNLFMTNRFYGVDRIGDTHHLSYALSSKLYAQDGLELINIGLGQTRYFSDRKVTLGTDTIQNERFSEYFAKANFNLGHINWINTAKLDKDDFSFLASNSRLQWQPQTNQALFVQYSLSEDDYQYENLSVGGYTPVTERTQLGIYSRYNLLTNLYESNQLLLRYQSCCWNLQMGVERSEFENGLSDTKLQLLFEFNGLSSQNSSNKFQNEIMERIYY
ncbi:LPS-assembly protein LptD [Thiomicrorhabdus indica]|uniref:LPS-assembly protein LptD n=1 Tax=Thiomicrorhabdus indica TaxID=2267253 RepID=UPI00102DC74E|nr:LPS assembly protein LptD [Thiomicrorhabdus indica]